MLSIVTGGAGFLGSHLVDALLAEGDEVVAIDNLSTGKLSNIEAAMANRRFTFLFLDVAQPVTIIRPCIDEAILLGRKIDRIFHLASPASPEAYGGNQWATLAVNGVGTMSLIEVALADSARFIFASTSEIYGDPLVHPQPETYFGNVDPIGPRSCYDEGKRFGEAAVAAAVRTRELDARIVRFFNCYGPRMEKGDGRLVPALVSAALQGTPLPIQGTGSQTRSMTYVDDAITLLLKVATASHPSLSPVNIGNDDERSVLEIATVFASVAGVAPNFDFEAARPGDPQRRKPVLEVARSLGWAPSTQLEDGLKRTFDWFSSERLTYI